VFGPIEHNPATHALAEALDRLVGPGASATKLAEHALSDTHLLRALVNDAGFEEVAIETLVKAVRFSSADDYVRVQLSATPLASLVAGRDDDDRSRLLTALAREVGAALADYHDGKGMAFPQEVHILTGRTSTTSTG
jgi:hypothetical protein